MSHVTPSRPYTSADDLRRIQAATAAWIAASGFAGYLHVGDIALRLFNGMRRYPPGAIVRLWEGAAAGTLLGWAIIYPRWNSFDALLHPAQRGSDLERQMLDWCEGEITGWMRREGRPNDAINLDVFAEDTVRITELEARGYSRSDNQHVIGVRALTEPLPEILLPAGFAARPADGVLEAATLIEAQNATFGWSWTVDDFRRVMQSLAGHLQPYVVVAPDGRLASFCYLMLDTHNHIGMFEDVGTHPDFQRRGLARALLSAGLNAMRTQGMVTAMIPYLATETAAAGLYASAGFHIHYQHMSYVKILA